MSLVKYIGPLPAVYVPSAGESCEKGNSIEVSEEIAASLLMLPEDWEAGDEETKELTPHFPHDVAPFSGFAGPYDPTTVYPSDVMVTEHGLLYMSLKAGVGETPILAPHMWQPFVETAEEPEEPAEGQTTASRGVAAAITYLHKSDSNAASTWSLELPQAIGEEALRVGPLGFPVLAFYNAATGQSYTPAELECTVVSEPPTPPFGFRTLKLTFATHAKAPLKKGETLAIIAIG